MAAGHPDAANYPLAMLWDEAELLVQRQNNHMITAAVLMQGAMSSTGMTATKESVKRFTELIKGLDNGE